MLLLCLNPSYGQKKKKDIFDRSNLTAWCVVPFDARKRNPEQRAQMLNDLKINKLAYDWRQEHIPTFDDELKALNRHRVTLQAFWMATDYHPGNNPDIQAIFDFLERNQVKTEIWLLLGTGGADFDALPPTEKIKKAAEPIRYIANRAAGLGCKVGLYNHGGWFGEPENQISIIEYLNLPNIGIVYNFHHARQHYERFPSFYPKMLPYLLSVNIAGLKTGDRERFYRVGQGDLEKDMIRMVWESSYSGPIGIINHDTEEDAAVGLQTEMDGLKQLLDAIGNGKAARSYK